MEEKKKSTMRWILEWAGQKKMDYVWSVILGMGNVIFKIIPYFLIATIVRMFLEGNKDFNTYLKKFNMYSYFLYCGRVLSFTLNNSFA